MPNQTRLHIGDPQPVVDHPAENKPLRLERVLQPSDPILLDDAAPPRRGRFDVIIDLVALIRSLTLRIQQPLQLPLDLLLRREAVRIE